METAIKQSREERAEEILSCGRSIIKTSEGYRVPSMRDGDKYYLVAKRNGRITCTCPDYENKISAEENGNGETNGNGHLLYCKHILSAFRAVKTGQIAIEKPPTVTILEYPFREDQILQKNGRDYVEGATIIQRLLDSGVDWSFEILETKTIEDEVIAKGRLTLFINGREIRKEQYGGAVFSRTKDGDEIVSRADTLKAASTDALKKCATLLGVGLHLYSENDRYLSFTRV